jgi:hypothetical protein
LALARVVLPVEHVTETARDGNNDHRIDVVVYVLWAAVLLILLRYV